MTTAEKQQLVKRLQDGKARARANRPAELAEIEAAMDAENAVYRGARAKLDYGLMADSRGRIAELGAQRSKVQRKIDKAKADERRQIGME